MVDNKINQYLFITTGSYPVGNAATNRALSYSRGIAELGCKVTILVLGPEYNQSRLSNKRRLIYNGVEIAYSSPLLFVKRGIVGKINYLFGVLLGFVKLVYLLFKFRSSMVVSLLIADPLLLRLFIFPVKLFKSKVFHERTEFPFLNRKNKHIYNYYLYRIIPLFDGIYVISFLLVDFFKNLTINPILHLPMTVELDRFQIRPLPSGIKYIAYCGSMYTDKDGVPDLIEAYNLIASDFKDLYLYLIGDNSDKIKFQLIQNKIDASPFFERIICTGHVNRDSMPRLLKNAALLALCRPDNMQAKGGFPTKLGEYLATSNPVVITNVGDHTKYLQDGISAFISQPDNPVHFSEKLKECLNNYDLAKEVGKAGYQVAKEHFNYKVQAERLKEFIAG